MAKSFQKKKLKKPLFIVFEGVDGAGSSTQTQLLSEWFKKHNLPVLATKEPTNNLIGGLIRGVLTKEWALNPAGLQLLFSADRAHHLQREIEPALKKGINVICDRYLYSSIAFGGLDLEFDWLWKINKNFLTPDIVFWLKISPQTAINRINQSRAGFELFEEVKKMEKINQNYQKIAKRLKNFYEIDAEQTPQQMLAEEIKIVKRFFHN